jgi:predicted Zn-dependent protease
LLLLGAESTLKSKDSHTQAMVFKALGQTAEARTVLQSLVARKPRQLNWRYEFAQLLYEEGKLQEARTELLTVLAQQPAHREAHELLSITTQELLKRK